MSYDPALDEPEKVDMSVAIGSSSILKRGDKFKKVSEVLEKRPVASGVKFNQPDEMIPGSSKSINPSENSNFEYENDSMFNIQLFHGERKRRSGTSTE